MNLVWYSLRLVGCCRVSDISECILVSSKNKLCVSKGTECSISPASTWEVHCAFQEALNVLLVWLWRAGNGHRIFMLILGSSIHTIFSSTLRRILIQKSRSDTFQRAYLSRVTHQLGNSEFSVSARFLTTLDWAMLARLSYWCVLLASVFLEALLRASATTQIIVSKTLIDFFNTHHAILTFILAP